MNHTHAVVPQQLLDYVMLYYSMGLSVIPVSRRTKKATRKWKQYQRQRADPTQLQEWFRDADAELLTTAVICGSLSGNLVVRDFDERSAYDRWASDNPDLAAALPTVQTGRAGGHGRHVWARAPHTLRTKQLCDGHPKGEGGYVIVPPSLHATGTPYTWQSENWRQQIPVLSLNDIACLAGSKHWNTEVLCSSVSLGAPEAHQELSEPAPESTSRSSTDLLGTG